MYSISEKRIYFGMILSVFFANYVYCNTSVPRVRLNLDLPPRQRWDSVLKHFDIQTLRGYMNKVITDLLSSRFLRPIVLKLAAEADKYIPYPYSEELRGIADTVGVDLGSVVLFNYYYDLQAYANSTVKACTSIVSMDKSNRVIHSRNLDFDYSSLLRKVTMDIEFQRGGKIQYIGTTIAGFAGILNGIRPKTFSYSFNQRNEGSWWENLVAALEQFPPGFVVMREILEKATSFEQAIEVSKEVHSVAPMYLILGGVKEGEGAVVVRNRKGSIDVSRMNSSLEHKWFVVETNYDPWEPPPQDDDRRDVAIQSMTSIGRSHMDIENLFKVLSKPPVLNPDTVYTTTMSAIDESTYRTVIRTAETAYTSSNDNN